MRYIHDIFTPTVGVTVANPELKEHYLSVVEAAELEEATREKLRESIAYFLMGDRRRQSVDSWAELDTFASRASAFEAAVNGAVAQIAANIIEKTDGRIQLDAILSTTSTGSLMPSISYRVASQLGSLVRPDTMMIDLAHVGCTGGIKLLNIVKNLEPSVKHCLLVSLEFPTTLINMLSQDVDVWQGNCTFGDGGAALWISNDPEFGDELQVDEVMFRQHSQRGLDLIRWGYSDYYCFRLADESTFNRDVREFVADSLREVDKRFLESPQWAVHPAGLALLMRISRRIGLNKRAMADSAEHYNRFSNMSSAGVLHVLRDVAAKAESGSDINICTMGAGFNVIYSRIKKNETA